MRRAAAVDQRLWVRNAAQVDVMAFVRECEQCASVDARQSWCRRRQLRLGTIPEVDVPELRLDRVRPRRWDRDRGGHLAPLTLVGRPRRRQTAKPGGRQPNEAGRVASGPGGHSMTEGETAPHTLGPPPIDIASVATPPVRPAPKPAPAWCSRSRGLPRRSSWGSRPGSRCGAPRRQRVPIRVRDRAIVFPFLVAAIYAWSPTDCATAAGSGLPFDRRGSPRRPPFSRRCRHSAYSGPRAAGAVDAATAMQVSAPFTLRETDPATAQQIEQGRREDPGTRSIAVREVVGADLRPRRPRVRPDIRSLEVEVD